MSASSSAPAGQGSFLLLGRADCHLCEQMAEALALEFPDLAFTWADVDSRPEWQRRWGLKIPVLLDPAGQRICSGLFDAEAVRQALAELRRPSP